MKVSILDDYHDTLHTLPSFQKLKDFEVEIWNDHTQDTDMLAGRLKDTEALAACRTGVTE
jgi:D-3-phosphoglycerate dehydrogenase / 2-oxoglutarate reductase